MKPYAIGIFLAFLPLIVNSQNNSCEAPDHIKAYYLRDAQQIALRQMMGDTLWEDSVNIPDYLYQPVLDALLAVYNAKHLPERDTVMECLDIHTFPFPSGDRLVVAADPSFGWVNKLKNNILPTGEAAIDALIFEFQLQMVSHLDISGSVIFDLKSKNVLNQEALARRFEAVQGVLYAEVKYPLGDGSDIETGWVFEGTVLKFVYKWGDCPAGCIFSREWSFFVYFDCEVYHTEVKGDPLDAQFACSGSFECATEPLCNPWVRDTLAHYMNTFPTPCNPPNAGFNLRLYPQPSGESVYILDELKGIDAETFRFYNCSGDALGVCNITIAGMNCSNPSLVQYLDAPIVWDCTEPLPTPQNCSASSTKNPAAKTMHFEIVPNPNSGAALLQFGDRPIANGRVSVLDLQGRMLQEEKLSASVSHLLNTTSLPTGIYVVRVESDNSVALKRMMVEN